jgi:23S rRNA (adenine-N6)-dimethyltransferase
LRQRFAAADVTVVQFDLAEVRPPRHSFRVVANPPYSMSTAIVRSLLDPRSGIGAADLVLQRALVRRLSEGRAPGGQRWLREFDIQHGRSLPRAAFAPSPHIDSAVLVIRRRGGLPRHRR